MNKSTINSISRKIKKRQDFIKDRNPHEHEFEAGSEDLECSLLNTIEYSLFSENLFPIEKTKIPEAIIALRSVLTLLETRGKIHNERDNYPYQNLIKEFKNFKIKSSLVKNKKDINYEQDFYNILEVYTESKNKILLSVLNVDCYCSQEEEAYLYLWNYEDKKYATNSQLDVIRFFLHN